MNEVEVHTTLKPYLLLWQVHLPPNIVSVCVSLLHSAVRSVLSCQVYWSGVVQGMFEQYLLLLETERCRFLLILATDVVKSYMYLLCSRPPSFHAMLCMSECVWGD